MSPRATEVLARHHRQVGEELLVLLSPRGQVDLVGHLGEGEVRGDLVFVWLDLGGGGGVLGLRLVLIARVGAKGRRGTPRRSDTLRRLADDAVAGRGVALGWWWCPRLGRRATIVHLMLVQLLVLLGQPADRATRFVSACPPYRLQRIRSRWVANVVLRATLQYDYEYRTRSIDYSYSVCIRKTQYQ